MGCKITWLAIVANTIALAKASTAVAPIFQFEFEQSTCLKKNAFETPGDVVEAMAFDSTLADCPMFQPKTPARGISNGISILTTNGDNKNILHATVADKAKLKELICASCTGFKEYSFTFDIWLQLNMEEIEAGEDYPLVSVSSLDQDFVAVTLTKGTTQTDIGVELNNKETSSVMTVTRFENDIFSAPGLYHLVISAAESEQYANLLTITVDVNGNSLFGIIPPGNDDFSFWDTQQDIHVLVGTAAKKEKALNTTFHKVAMYSDGYDATFNFAETLSNAPHLPLNSFPVMKQNNLFVSVKETLSKVDILPQIMEQIYDFDRDVLQLDQEFKFKLVDVDDQNTNIQFHNELDNEISKLNAETTPVSELRVTLNNGTDPLLPSIEKPEECFGSKVFTKFKVLPQDQDCDNTGICSEFKPVGKFEPPNQGEFEIDTYINVCVEDVKQPSKPINGVSSVKYKSRSAVTVQFEDNDLFESRKVILEYDEATYRLYSFDGTECGARLTDGTELDVAIGVNEATFCLVYVVETQVTEALIDTIQLKFKVYSETDDVDNLLEGTQTIEIANPLSGCDEDIEGNCVKEGIVEFSSKDTVDSYVEANRDTSSFTLPFEDTINLPAEYQIIFNSLPKHGALYYYDTVKGLVEIKVNGTVGTQSDTESDDIYYIPKADYFNIGSDGELVDVVGNPIRGCELEKGCPDTFDYSISRDKNTSPSSTFNLWVNNVPTPIVKEDISAPANITITLGEKLKLNDDLLVGIKDRDADMKKINVELDAVFGELSIDFMNVSKADAGVVKGEACVDAGCTIPFDMNAASSIINSALQGLTYTLTEKVEEDFIDIQITDEITETVTSARITIKVASQDSIRFIETNDQEQDKAERNLLPWVIALGTIVALFVLVGVFFLVKKQSKPKEARLSRASSRHESLKAVVREGDDIP